MSDGVKTARLVLWDSPAGEGLSHRGWSGEPQRDLGHSMAMRRFLIDVPAELAAEIVRLVPCCEFAEDAEH